MPVSWGPYVPVWLNSPADSTLLTLLTFLALVSVGEDHGVRQRALPAVTVANGDHNPGPFIDVVLKLCLKAHQEALRRWTPPVTLTYRTRM